MPGRITEEASPRKRKREDGVKTKSRKAPRTATTGESTQTRILALEEQILLGREHYNNIVELQALSQKYGTKPKAATLAAVSLCRVFSRLIAEEALVKSDRSSDPNAQIAKWLRARLRDYEDSLLTLIGTPDDAQESTALTLLMRIVKAETSQGDRRSHLAWATETSTFYRLVKRLVEETEAEGARQAFVEKYVEEHDDLRFHTFAAIKHLLKSTSDPSEASTTVGNALDVLSRIEQIPEFEDQLEDWFGEPPAPTHKQLRSLTSHRKIAQEAWLAIFRSPLMPIHRKRILGIATTVTLPIFSTRLEYLADFLTDSFDAGGSTALLALSSIFHLITKQNLEYPDFYPKLYSLLDDDVLHSRHRSRFFRQLETFMASEHLPAALVASFVKRLARLCLQAPPGAIVWIVPWVYNMMKSHPACTFMLHRPWHPAHKIWASTPAPPGVNDEAELTDPFSMEEADPMTTGAIDSSLWELQTLQSHYHPNVATLARILGEQFTKRGYQLEDFLDHSYASLLEAELGRELKAGKVVEVEYEIPKRIATRGEEDGGGLNEVGGLLAGALGAL
ncbi:Maturation and nuclear export of 40S ribosomal subunits interacting protein [Teratosphaeriaceae sp. CCFEE 6253]|nr:Maturation and nuclear export of 40S ribosomal subunits interacting protein [Teratosphaeriaceae sp. CCFEE 6253]